MQLTVRDVAKLLKVSEKTIYRWLKKGEIPAYRVRDQYRFNRSELLEWVASNRVDLKVDLFTESEPEPDHSALPELSQALEAGGVFYRVSGRDRDSALRSVVSILRLPEETDRELLLRILLAREDMASTAIGDGIAIPHVRNPIILQVTRPMICLCFLENPVDFGALDGQLVNTLFSLICPSTRIHLHLLSRLGFALHDPGFKAAILHQAAREQIFAELQRVETLLGQRHSS